MGPVTVADSQGDKCCDCTADDKLDDKRPWWEHARVDECVRWTTLSFTTKDWPAEDAKVLAALEGRFPPDKFRIWVSVRYRRWDDGDGLMLGVGCSVSSTYYVLAMSRWEQVTLEEEGDVFRPTTEEEKAIGLQICEGLGIHAPSCLWAREERSRLLEFAALYERPKRVSNHFWLRRWYGDESCIKALETIVESGISCTGCIYGKSRTAS